MQQIAAPKPLLSMEMPQEVVEGIMVGRIKIYDYAGVAFSPETVQRLSADPPERGAEKTRYLNDEIMNTYLKILKETLPNQQATIVLPTFAFSIWKKQGVESDSFQNCMCGLGIQHKFHIFSAEKVILPINLNNLHWCCAVAYLSNGNLEVGVYDPMSQNGIDENVSCLLQEVSHMLVQWGTQLGLKKSMLSPSLRSKSHQHERVQHSFSIVPKIHYFPFHRRQMNAYDCGVFTALFAEFIMNGWEHDAFSQEDMPKQRKRILYTIYHRSSVY